MTTLDDLSNEMLVETLSYLSTEDLYNFYLSSSNDIASNILGWIGMNYLLPEEKDKLEFLNYAIRDRKLRSYNYMREILALSPEKLLTKGLEYGLVYLVKDAIAKGAKSDLKLKYVASKGYWDIFDYFVELKSTDTTGAIEGAAYGGYIDVVKKVLETSRYSTVETAYGIEGAIAGDHVEILEYLLSDKGPGYFNPGLEVRNGEILGVYMLENAAKTHSIKTIKYLIDKGYNDYNSGLIGAAIGGHRDLVDYFIQLGADEFNEPLIMAASGGYRDLVEYFVKLGADDFNGALSKAIRGGHVELVDYFLDLGANEFDGPNDAAAAAASVGDINIINKLISLGVNNLDYALISATRNGHIEIAYYLISKGAEAYSPAFSEGLFAYFNGRINIETLEKFLKKLVKLGVEDKYINEAYRQAQSRRDGKLNQVLRNLY